MLTIDTYVDKSKIQGLGVYTNRPLKKGDIVWRYQDGFDSTISEQELLKLPEVAQKTIKHYMFFSKDLDAWVIMPDEAKFFNHSKTPNTTTVPDNNHKEPMTIANCDINADEELTCDYYEFEADLDSKNI